MVEMFVCLFFGDFFKQCECEESNLILNFAAIFLRKEDKKVFCVKIRARNFGGRLVASTPVTSTTLGLQ